MKTVMIFGTFDILHAGHFYLFKEARKKGEHVIAVVARDSNVEKLKGSKPFHNELERKNILTHIDYIDKVVLGDMYDVYKIIRKVKPDLIVLGYDQKNFVDSLYNKLDEHKLNTKVIRLKSYQSESYKTSKIKDYLNKFV